MAGWPCVASGVKLVVGLGMAEPSTVMLPLVTTKPLVLTETLPLKCTLPPSTVTSPFWRSWVCPEPSTHTMQGRPGGSRATRAAESTVMVRMPDERPETGLQRLERDLDADQGRGGGAVEGDAGRRGWRARTPGRRRPVHAAHSVSGDAEVGEGSSSWPRRSRSRTARCRSRRRACCRRRARAASAAFCDWRLVSRARPRSTTIAAMTKSTTATIDTMTATAPCSSLLLATVSTPWATPERRSAGTRSGR